MQRKAILLLWDWVSGEVSVQNDQMQQIIELLEKQTRNAGYLYSADLLGIAAVSLQKEIDLSKEFPLEDKKPLENTVALH